MRSAIMYAILKTEKGVYSLSMKEISGKVCILYGRNVNPETEFSKGPVQSNRRWWKHFHPVSLKSLKWTLPVRNQDGSPLWGFEENGLIYECCDNVQDIYIYNIKRTMTGFFQNGFHEMKM